MAYPGKYPVYPRYLPGEMHFPWRSNRSQPSQQRKHVRVSTFHVREHSDPSHRTFFADDDGYHTVTALTHRSIIDVEDASCPRVVHEREAERRNEKYQEKNAQEKVWRLRKPKNETS